MRIGKERPGSKWSLDGDDHFARRTTLVHMAERVDDLTQQEAPIDHGSELARGDQPLSLFAFEWYTNDERNKRCGENCRGAAQPITRKRAGGPGSCWDGARASGVAQSGTGVPRVDDLTPGRFIDLNTQTSRRAVTRA
jgi:hypothetical protein